MSHFKLLSFFLLILEVSLCVREINLLSVIWFEKYFFSICHLSFEIVYDVCEASLVDQLVKNPPAMQETPGLRSSPGEGLSYPLQYSWASLVAQMVKNPPTMQETWVQSLGWGDPLEERMATHSNILAWRIPWTEEPDRLQSMGQQRDMTEWLNAVDGICLYILYHTQFSKLLQSPVYQPLVSYWFELCLKRLFTPKTQK